MDTNDPTRPNFLSPLSHRSAEVWARGDIDDRWVRGLARSFVHIRRFLPFYAGGAVFAVAMLVLPAINGGDGRSPAGSLAGAGGAAGATGGAGVAAGGSAGRGGGSTAAANPASASSATTRSARFA